MSTISVFKTDSVYLSSLFSMSILTRNKLEDWQLLLGISTLAGLWVPVTRALRDHVMGIDRTSDGHSLPVLWASSAHFVGWLLGTILSKRIRIFSICSWLQFCVFVQCFMVIWWYFYGNHDTSMTLLCKHIWKCYFANRYVSVIYLQTMILWDFFQEKTFMCEDKEWVNLRHL